MYFNNTTSNVTSVSATPGRHLTVAEQSVITVAYCCGILANFAALWKLYRSETLRNKRQTLMIKCLLYNDLIAVSGSLILMYIQLNGTSEIRANQWFCAIRVFWRTFGFGSGSVAIVMAIERYIALINPFAYHKHVTYCRIKMGIFILWGISALMSCFPFLGFGLYYDSVDPTKSPSCMRYRQAFTTKDKAYAYLVFSFGLIMCSCIVICNLAVVVALCKLNKQHNANTLSKHRHQQSSIEKQESNKEIRSSPNDEISFAKLMIILCISFVICWLPQFFIVMMSQMNPNGQSGLYRLGDMFLMLNFTVDPIFYVLYRHLQQKRISKICQPSCIPSCHPSGSTSSGLDNEMNTDKTSTSSKQRRSS